MRLIISVLLILIVSNVVAQDKEETEDDVWVQLFVYDADEHRVMENVQVISFRSMLVYLTDSIGSVHGFFQSGDSLKVSGMGFQPVVVKVDAFKGKENGKMVFLSRQTYMLRAVDITADKDFDLHMPGDINMGDDKEDDTPISLRSSYGKKKPAIYKAAINPVGFAHYYLSKEERQKRKNIKELQEEEKRQKIRKIFNRDIVAFVTGYKDKELDDFMLYCNMHLEVTENSNPIIVQQDVLDLTVKYEEEKKQNKEVETEQ